MNSTFRHLIRQNFIISRSIVKIGDKVPVVYVKGQDIPVVKADSEYPDWVLKLHEKLPTRAALYKKFKDTGVESMTIPEIKRLKRLGGVENIKEQNLEKLTSD